jgi:hypothetical protein
MSLEASAVVCRQPVIELLKDVLVRAEMPTRTWDITKALVALFAPGNESAALLNGTAHTVRNPCPAIDG